MNGRTMQVQSGNGNGAVGSEEYPSIGAAYAPLMIWGSGPYQFCTFANRKWLRFAGGPSMTEVQNGWSGEIHPDDLTRCVRSHQRAFIRRSSFRLEYRVRDLSG